MTSTSYVICTVPYMPDTQDARLEIRLSQDLLTKIDAARGDIPRAAWVRRALEAGITQDDQDLETLIAVRFALERGADIPDSEDHRRAGIALAAMPKGTGRNLAELLDALPRGGGRRIQEPTT